MGADPWPTRADSGEIDRGVRLNPYLTDLQALGAFVTNRSAVDSDRCRGFQDCLASRRPCLFGSSPLRELPRLPSGPTTT
jgi:hypothetical protein